MYACGRARIDKRVQRGTADFSTAIPRARDACSSCPLRLSFSFFLLRVYKYTPLLTLLHWTSLARILRNAVGREPGLRKRQVDLLPRGRIDLAISTLDKEREIPRETALKLSAELATAVNTAEDSRRESRATSRGHVPVIVRDL